MVTSEQHPIEDLKEEDISSQIETAKESVASSEESDKLLLFTAETIVEELSPTAKVELATDDSSLQKDTHTIPKTDDIQHDTNALATADESIPSASMVVEDTNQIEKLKQTLIEIEKQERMMDLIIENAAKQETSNTEEFLTHLRQHEDSTTEQPFELVVPQISVAVVTSNVEETVIDKEESITVEKPKDKTPTETLIENMSMDESYWLTRSIYEESESNWQIHQAEKRIQELSKQSTYTVARCDVSQLAHNLTLDKFWFTKHIYDEAERLWQEEMTQKSKLQAGGDGKKPSDRSPDDDGDDSDSSGGSRSPLNKPGGEAALTAPGSEYMMYTLPGGIAGWKETSTYLTPEPLTDLTDVSPSPSPSLGPEQQPTSPVGGESSKAKVDAEQKGKKKGKWLKKDLTEEVQNLQLSLESTEGTIEYLPKESFEDMIEALEGELEDLRGYENF
ncbi:unnamed protein product [Callosobruchus maculatus]|uniref:Uncharacterized protein n=1 Tax=Callosobruchus maculatus TaxID=64391 RepID=A0A653D1J5_CALMS|nr:unnamed protein product [Callosobruchus maculatus]